MILKYLLIYIAIISITTMIALEMDFEIITYLIIYGIIGVGVFFLLKYLNYLKPVNLLIVIITSLIPTYIVTASIIITETDLAYSKITSIPKERLAEYYKTKDLNIIPEDKRRTWIGVLYREIEIVDSNRSGNIKAVGWKGNSVFAYYNLMEDDFSASYH